ncbi:MAG: hypothetical protein M1812_001370 [Candelaria pacifica]|nr:MAG: hypothetical protein M1812_001370 [Candelaria pacifica]
MRLASPRYTVLASFNSSSLKAPVTPRFLSSALSSSPVPPGKTLVKRPVIRTEPSCDADYGQPDYLACLIGASWIPPDGGDLNTVRVFSSMPETASRPLAVQLPITVSAGNCFIRIGIVEAAGRSTTDWGTWEAMRDAAKQVTHRCVGARGSGGTFVAGEALGLTITVYSESSDFRNALLALAQASSIAESLCESTGSNEATTEVCAKDEASSSHWYIPAYRPSSSGSSCSSRLSAQCILKIVQRSDLLFGLPIDRLIGTLVPQLLSSSRKLIKGRYALEKRVDPPHCSNDYGFPNPSACHRAWAQMPTETISRVFVPGIPIGAQVQLPFSRIGYLNGRNNPCIITVSNELNAPDVSSFSDIRNMAAAIIDTCLGWPGARDSAIPGVYNLASIGWGGYQLGGLNGKISVTVYASNSKWNDGINQVTKCRATSDTEDRVNEMAVNDWCSGVLRDEPLAQCDASYCTSGESCCEGYKCMPLRPEKASVLLGLLSGIGVGSCLRSSMLNYM